MNRNWVILFSQFLGISIICLLIVGSISDNFVVEEPVVVPASPPKSSTVLEVRPSQGTPEPVQDLIQGTRNSVNQEAAGDLQNPRRVDELQPNAKISDFPSEQ